MKTAAKANAANDLGEVVLGAIDPAQLALLRKRTSISDVGRAKNIKDNL